MYLYKNEQLSMKNLLYALMLESANAAAIAPILADYDVAVINNGFNLWKWITNLWKK